MPMNLVKKYYKGVVLGIFIGLLLGGAMSWLLFFRNQENTINNPPALGLEQEIFKVEIPKLGVVAPVIIGVNPSNEEEYDKALTRGVVLMPGPGIVGKRGNVVIYGHSSAEEEGPYQKIFATLNDLTKGDKVKIFYQGVEHIYEVREKKIVMPDDFSILNQTETEVLTLFTCWPIGTDKERLVIISERA